MHRELNAIKKIKHQRNSVNFFISEHIKKTFHYFSNSITQTIGIFKRQWKETIDSN